MPHNLPLVFPITTFSYNNMPYNNMLCFMPYFITYVLFMLKFLGLSMLTTAGNNLIEPNFNLVNF